MAIVAGVDFGTLSVRVSIVDSGRGRLGSGTAEYPLHRKKSDPDHATQSHQDQMDALVAASRRAVEAAGIDGQSVEALALVLAAVRNALPRTTEFFTQAVLVPPAMQQVPGVNLMGLPVERAGFYYEVCFRCHGDLPVPVADRIVRQQDTLGNVRREFLPTAPEDVYVFFAIMNVPPIPLFPVHLHRKTMCGVVGVIFGLISTVSGIDSAWG
jgi:hypothetical protein